MTSKQPVLDLDHLDMMTGSDRALQLELFALFETQTRLWRPVLVPSGCANTWRDAAHSIKGSARGLGLGPLADAAEAAEMLAKSGVKDGPLAKRGLNRLLRELDGAMARIAVFRGESVTSAASEALG